MLFQKGTCRVGRTANMFSSCDCRGKSRVGTSLLPAAVPHPEHACTAVPESSEHKELTAAPTLAATPEPQEAPTTPAAAHCLIPVQIQTQCSPCSNGPPVQHSPEATGQELELLSAPQLVLVPGPELAAHLIARGLAIILMLILFLCIKNYHSVSYKINFR